ncbi:MAG: recombinase family protein [Lachnospiraceae bacterium]|nr:recombinase family protein [Lachnospiraceae bacterium]
MGKRNRLNIMEGQTETFHYEPPTPAAWKEGVRRTAAYCRVSTLSEDQELSVETHSGFYMNLIEQDPTMTLVGIYGDQGFSGLKADKRKEFQRLIADCLDGKIDLVLVKSISRFSRNTVECMEYLKQLKEYGVAVLFEKEGLNSLDPKTEMILSIYASMAQNESCSHSENIRWAHRRQAEMGDPIRGACYGYRVEKKKGDKVRRWVIVEEEAKRIRLMFDMAYKGYSLLEILERLNRVEEELDSGDKWSPSRVQLALSREAYRGDILTDKHVTLDYLSKKSVRNKGQVDQYYIEQHHDPIVDPALYDIVQEYREKGYLNARNKLLRQSWFEEHPEILQRRTNEEEA